MKTAILLLAGAMSTAVSLNGQIPAGLKLGGDVPFSFYQGTELMPAGRYELHNTTNGALMLTNPQAGRAAMSLTAPRIGSVTPTGYMLFRCYGEPRKCFLGAVAVPGSASRMEVPASKLEKEMARGRSERQVAYVGFGQSTAACE